ncbi:MAG: hypothetical protein CL789_04040 [Chloroflexi bacterium]|nr:hypothetical protein [Chloroflexota bacterium]HCU80433.1 hypothetical protein [Chloroflexota bacterium]|tara:strand:- start:1552 stop:2472 length:921 start_codon:yes stop_codon:yes gene_type:complete
MIPRAPDVSVIIVTYNSAQVIIDCIDSIINNSQDVEVEILIVDNGSTDHTCETITHHYPDINLMSGHGNLGFAAGNNMGMEAAQGRHFLILNPDTEVSSGALKTLTDYADLHPTAGMIAPHLVNPDGTLQHSTFRFPNLAQAFFGFFEKLVPIDSTINGRYPPEAYQKERCVEHILGAAIFVQRVLWNQIGGMDENYHLYFEETDWCYRARKLKWNLHYLPSATIMHSGAHSTISNPERNSVLFAQSQSRFYRTNLGVFSYLMLKLITIIGLEYWAVRSVLAVLKGNLTTDECLVRLQSYHKILWA